MISIEELQREMYREMIIGVPTDAPTWDSMQRIHINLEKALEAQREYHEWKKQHPGEIREYEIMSFQEAA